VKVTLVEMSAELLDADVAGRTAEMGDALRALVEEWPPVGGEWDHDAMRFFRSRIDEPAFDPRWGPRYVTLDGRLVASAGFFGPPDEDGHVEIGYSVCLGERGKGIATATVAVLCEIARASGATAVDARTTTTNVASLRTLERNRFVVIQTSENDAGDVALVLRRRLSPPPVS